MSISMDTRKVVSSDSVGNKVGEAVAEAMKAASTELIMPRHNKEEATVKKLTVDKNGKVSGDISKLVEQAENEKYSLERQGRKVIADIINSKPKLDIKKAEESMEDMLKKAQKLSIFGGTEDIVPEPSMINKYGKNEAEGILAAESAIKGAIISIKPKVEKIMEDTK